MIEFLFIDLDDTVLDFHKAEHIAVRKTLTAFGLEPTDAVCARYSAINKEHWERLERKELTRQQVLVGRFHVLFRQMGVAADPEAVARQYEENLSVGHYFLPGAQEAVKALSGKYKLYLASNGTTHVQRPRLASAGISRYFQQIFISQEMGADKPSTEFFQRCFARIPGFDPSCAMMVGDSLSSDILGGRNAGIATCWVNPSHKPGREDIQPDHEIQRLDQLEALLDSLT